MRALLSSCLCCQPAGKFIVTDMVERLSKSLSDRSTTGATVLL